MLKFAPQFLDWRKGVIKLLRTALNTGSLQTELSEVKNILAVQEARWVER